MGDHAVRSGTRSGIWTPLSPGDGHTFPGRGDDLRGVSDDAVRATFDPSTPTTIGFRILSLFPLSLCQYLLAQRVRDQPSAPPARAARAGMTRCGRVDLTPRLIARPRDQVRFMLGCPPHAATPRPQVPYRLPSEAFLTSACGERSAQRRRLGRVRVRRTGAEAAGRLLRVCQQAPRDRRNAPACDTGQANSVPTTAGRSPLCAQKPQEENREFARRTSRSSAVK